MNDLSGLVTDQKQRRELRPLDALLAGRRLVIGVGPIRNGTTWLFQCLRQHPQVCSTVEKEINFFNDNLERGPSWYLNRFQIGNPASPRLLDISPHYLDMFDIGDRISQMTASPFILVGIRNPYDRLISDYRRHYSHKRITVVATQPRAFQHVCRANLVAAPIEKLFKTFGREQVIVYNFDDLRQSPAALLDRLCAAIGVERFIPINVERRILASVAPRNRFLLSGARAALRSLSALAPALATKLMFSRVRRFVYTDRPQGDITDAERAEVFRFYQPIFEAEIDRQEKLLNLDLGHWRLKSVISAQKERVADATAGSQSGAYLEGQEARG